MASKRDTGKEDIKENRGEMQDTYKGVRQTPPGSFAREGEGQQSILENARDKIKETIFGKDNTQESIQKGTGVDDYTRKMNAAKDKGEEVYEQARNLANKAKDKANQKYQETIQESGSRTDMKDKSVYEGVKDKVLEGYDKAKEWVQESSTTTQKAADKAKNTAEAAKEKSGEMYETAKEKAGEMYETAKEKAGDMYRKSGQSEPTETLESRGTFTSGANSTNYNDKSVLEQGKEKVKDAIEGVKEKAKDLYEGGKEKLEEGKEKAKDMYDRNMNTTSDRNEGNNQSAKEKAQEIGESIKDKSKQVFNKESAKEAKDKVQEKAEGVYQETKEKVAPGMNRAGGGGDFAGEGKTKKPQAKMMKSNEIPNNNTFPLKSDRRMFHQSAFRPPVFDADRRTPLQLSKPASMTVPLRVVRVPLPIRGVRRGIPVPLPF